MTNSHSPSSEGAFAPVQERVGFCAGAREGEVCAGASRHVQSLHAAAGGGLAVCCGKHRILASRVMDTDGEALLGKLRCHLFGCGCRLSFKSLKDPGSGQTVKPGDGSYRRTPGSRLYMGIGLDVVYPR